jgi:hypothetical protein
MSGGCRLDVSWRELNDLEAEGMRFENLAWSHWNAYP